MFVCLCVSVPRIMQFDLASCYSVHINTLLIELKCTSNGATCKLNYYDVADFNHVCVWESMNSMQYRSLNPIRLFAKGPIYYL